MRLPCTPLISKGCTFSPSKSNDNASETEVLGCGAIAIWNSNVVGAVISTSRSAATSRLISVPPVHRRSRLECGQQLTKRHGRDSDCGVADSVRQHQRPPVHQRAAGIYDIGDVAVLFVNCGAQQGLAQPTENPCRVVQI